MEFRVNKKQNADLQPLTFGCILDKRQSYLAGNFCIGELFIRFEMSI
ncbi:hypothetical protein SAMN05444280_110106 [Tangfeifania diversioriginum]|uniref:Uncharacterized protein n=1 Tax=Tangfeifania diversioriginum TaxID=1168035 RepID=A0A1M6GBS5_9BACT|nr:hypothetical protein SAMN05444280_110106 [Tangfeifania diversioriginum]